jgi:hypothetical protein
VPVVILLADGVRPDTLDAAITAGTLPALARICREGGALHTVTSCFPSVTGPAYAPFLMGRFPGPIGLPGLRWFDRARSACRFPDYTRSYVGYQMGAIDRDIDRDAPTIFELCERSVGALNVIGRGLPESARIGAITPRSALRAARTHFAGDVEGWLQIDRAVSDQVVQRVGADAPDFVFAAFTGVDKVSHARGQQSPMILDALRIVDDTAAALRADAERRGVWDATSLWVVSDHGHSRVTQHEDLVRVVQAAGLRVVAHPWVFAWRPDAAVMVSGNAMAHIYADLHLRARPAWRSLGAKWHALLEQLLVRASVDLVILPRDGGADVVSAARGRARLSVRDGAFSYHCETGDPLGVGVDLTDVSGDEAYDATMGGDYPDGVVQIAHLAQSPRSGEIILSAARGWDFRARFEPIPHVSSHGALHREHMLVPLLLSRAPGRAPRRTVDVMPSALAALGRPAPTGLDGQSFL